MFYYLVVAFLGCPQSFVYSHDFLEERKDEFTEGKLSSLWPPERRAQYMPLWVKILFKEGPEDL